VIYTHIHTPNTNSHTHTYTHKHAHLQFLAFRLLEVKGNASDLSTNLAGTQVREEEAFACGHWGEGFNRGWL